jgi:hypothetical protein
MSWTATAPTTSATTVLLLFFASTTSFLSASQDAFVLTAVPLHQCRLCNDMGQEPIQITLESCFYWHHTPHHSSRSRTDDPINESTSRHSKGKLHQRRTPSCFQPFFFFGSAILALEHFFLSLPTHPLVLRQVPPPPLFLSTGGLSNRLPIKTLVAAADGRCIQE